jgi:MFS family permease
MTDKSFAALRHPGYRAYFIGAAVAMMGDSIEHVISYWIVFQKFESQALAGFAVLAHWLPFLLFSLYSGALADRFDPRRLIQLGMALFMLASLGWALLFMFDALEMWHAAALLTVHGFAGVLWTPAAQIFIHQLVGERELHSAIRLSVTARWLGLLAGPAVGGAILLLMGPAYGLLFNVLVYLPLALWLWKAPLGRERPRPPAIRSFAELAAVARAIAANRTIVSMTLLAGGASLIVGNAYQAQMPEFARDLGHGDADFSYTMLLAADAAGALLAGLVLEGRNLLPPKPRTALVLAMLWCLALGGFALAASYPLALALLFAAGFLELAFYAMAQTLVQVRAPEALRGRVIGLFVMASLGLRAFSGITVGLGGAAIGIHWSLALSALAFFALTALSLIRIGSKPKEAA